MANASASRQQDTRKDARDRPAQPEVCEVAPPVPPDGGYGWVIMLASFVCNFIVDGVCFSFGIFYLEFLDYFKESKSKTSWVGSVLNGMYLSMGPIVSALANKFGCRAVTMAGAFVACLAYILASFSPNIDVLILTYGALGGAGFGLMYLPAIVMVGFYFEKRRAFATGVAVCGSGIGAFVFAPLSERLLSIYDWKGATIILAGITLNGLVMGALFRPLETSFSRRHTLSEGPTLDAADSAEAIANPQTPTVHLEDCDGNIPISIQNGHIGGAPSTHVARFPKGEGLLEPRDMLRSKMATNVERTMRNEAEEPEPDNATNERPLMQSLQNLSPTHLAGNNMLQRSFSKSVDDILLSQQKERERDAILTQRQNDLLRPMYRKDIFYSGSIMNLPEYKSNQDTVSYVRSVTRIPPSPEVDSSAKGNSFTNKCKALTDTMTEMMDFSLLKNPVFAIYGLSCFLCMLGFFVPFMYLPDDAIEKGIPRSQAAFLLSIIGIANTVARVLCGWVSDRPWADCLLINNMALIIGGIATMLCPFCISYGLLGTYAAVFGSCIAAFVSLRSILMVELLGLNKLTNAFGLVTMCQGMSSFIGAPIAGALFDITGTYDISFYFAGAMLASAGVICLPLRRLSHWQKTQNLAQKGVDSQTEQRAMMDNESGPVSQA